MNITRLNFVETLPYIKSIISQSHYVSIDLQMSGIVSDPQSNPSLVDSIQERYSKTKGRIEKFIPLQIGLCFHKIDSKQNKVTFYPFNFYIYPLCIDDSDSIKFSFHSASLNFLASNKFDFNRLFYQHIPFVSRQQLNQITLKKQKDKLMKQLMRLDTISSLATKAFLNINLPLVQKWVSQNKQLSELRINIQFIKYKSYKSLIDQIQRQYPSISFQFSFDSELIHQRSELVIKKQSSIDQKLNFDQQQKHRQTSLMNEVINCIVQKKMPIIVHNGFLDLMHIYLRFFQKLPVGWQIFCQKIAQQFPKIYDTKFICSNYPTIFQTLERMTNLGNCYEKLKDHYEKKNEQERQQMYKLEIDDDFKQYTFEGQQSHQAGFDALMTGYVFFRSMNMLKKSLQSLQKYEFHKAPSLMRNRIPLGNIKTPLNLEELTDFYKQHGNTVFQIRSLLNQTHTEEEISQYFKTNYGAINFYWKDKQKSAFFITFIDKNEQEKFTKNNLDQDGIAVLKFLNDKYLFKTLKLKKEVV